MKVRIGGINDNDVVNGEGVSVSLFTQGCPHHCKNCFNPESWDFNGGIEMEDSDVVKIIAEKLTANGVQRNLSFLGGEPLADENINLVASIISYVLWNLDYAPKIYIWTGYTLEELSERADENINLDYILTHTDALIDGPYVDELKDLTLHLRGSSNQRILNKQEIEAGLLFTRNKIFDII